MPSDSKLTQLQHFLTLADTGSLNKAALSIGTSKSAIRRSVAEIEERLGVDLFVRSRRGVVLSEKGRKFHERCSAILRNVYSVPNNIAGAPETRGTVTIGMTPIAAKLVAAPLLKAVSARFADIRLSLLEGYSFNIREWLDEGRVEIGLFYDGPGTNRTFATPVVSEQLLLVGAAGDEKLAVPFFSLGEALQFPLIVPGRPHGNRLKIEWFAEAHGYELKVAMEVDSLTLMTRLLAAGFGYALLPAVAIAEQLQAGVLRAVRIDPPFIRTLLLGRSARRMTSSRAELLVPLLQQILSEHCEGVDQYGRRAAKARAS